MGKKFKADDITPNKITSQNLDLGQFSDELNSICLAPSGDLWPSQNLKICSEHSVFKWFIPSEFGGLGLPPEQCLIGYTRIASQCLTTAFVITQRTAACNRITKSSNMFLKNELLPNLAAGDLFATVGISHLTTSHRHQQSPALSAKKTEDGIELNGFCPWVTGARFADYLVVGAEYPDGNQILMAVPKLLPGLLVDEEFPLMALSGSMTGRVKFERVLVPNEYLLAGPIDNVLAGGKNSATGGLQTSALAIGLASSAVKFVVEESYRRLNLEPIASALNLELDELRESLVSIASDGQIEKKTNLRSDANQFVLRATQSAMIAAKGAGFVQGHFVERWCREALFFLVWSCPQSVSDSMLCELAGVVE